MNSQPNPRRLFSRLKHNAKTLLKRRQLKRRLQIESLESRQLLAVAPYQEHFIMAPTISPQFNNTNYQLRLADWNNDGQQDLFAIKTQGVASGKTTVYIYSGATSFQTQLTSFSTALPLVGPDWQFRVAKLDGDSKPDLIAINRNSPLGVVNVNYMYGVNGYATAENYLVPSAPAHANGLWDFDVADWNNDGNLDLFGVLKVGASGSTEVHVYDGQLQSGLRFQFPIVHEISGLHATGNDFAFLARNYDGDSIPDVVAIKKYGTGTSSTEVHVLSGASNYHSFIEHVGTDLHETPGSSFQFDMLDYSGIEGPADGILDLIAFSTFNTGSGKTEIHGYSGQRTEAPTILIPFTPNVTVTELQAIQAGQVAIYEGQEITFVGVVEGPSGSQAVFSNGSFTVAANIQVGSVAIQTAFALLAGNTISAPQGVVVKAGDVAIDLNGTVNADFVIESGNLIGSPVIAGDFLGGGAIPAGTVALAVGHSPGKMTVNNLTLNANVTMTEQIFGAAPETEFDQIEANGNVILNSPKLILDAAFAADSGTEFVVIKNNGNGPVTGNFRDAGGAALLEGAIVSTNFGGTGRTARISYGGGDGNDVVIVVDGDYTFTSPTDGATSDLRIVTSSGITQFYVNGVLKQARTAAGLNRLNIQGEAGRIDNIRVDFGVDNPVPTAGIALSTGVDTVDSLTLLNGSADSVVQTLIDGGVSTIAITTGGVTKNVTYTKSSRVSDSLIAASRSFVMSSQAEIASLSSSATPGATRLNASAGRTIEFANPSNSLSLTTGSAIDKVTVNGLGSGFAAALNINTGSGADSITIAGNLTGLASLSTTASTISVNAASITTVGAQSYSGAAKLGTSTILSGTNLTFSSTINATVAGLDLTLNTTGGGTTSLLGTIGNVLPLRTLATNADGTTILKGNVTTASGTISFGDAVTLQANSILTSNAGSVAFAAPVNGPFAATINASTSTTIGDVVSGLTNLQVTAPLIALNASSITTTGQQIYSGAVSVGVSETITGSQLKFNSTLDAAADNVGLTLNTFATGVTNLLGHVGGSRAFASLTTDADGITNLKGNVTSNGGPIQFNDSVQLLTNLAISNTGTGTVSFGPSVGGAYNLTLAVAGTTTFAGPVGFVTPLGNSTGPAIDIASTGTTLFTKPVTTASYLVQRDSAGEVTFQDDVTITAASSDSLLSGNVVLDGMTFHSLRGITFGSDATDQVTLTTSDVTFDIPAAKIATMNSQLSGPSGLIKTGAGTLAIKTAAFYGGNTRITAGFLTRTAADQLPDTTHFIVDSGNTFSMQNLSETIAGLTGSGNVFLGTSTLTLANASDLFGGVMSGSGKLTLNGGTQYLTGANTYTGITTINSGKLHLDGGKIGANTAAGQLTIGSTAILSGTGSVNAAVNGLVGSTITSTGDLTLGLANSTTGFATSGKINVGMSGTVTLLDKDTANIEGDILLEGGTLAVARAFSMGTGQSLQGSGTVLASTGVMNLSGATLQPTRQLQMPGFTLDSTSRFSVAVGEGKIVASGPVELNGSQLTIGASGSYAHINGKQTVIIDNDGNDPIIGEFAGFEQGHKFDFGSERFSRMLYKSNDPSTANDVVVRALEYAVTPTLTVVNGNGTDPNVRFVTNDRGNTIYTWVTNQSIGGAISYVVYGPQGTPLGAVRTLSVPNQNFFYPRIVNAPGGGYAITATIGGSKSFVFLLDTNGNPVGSPMAFNTSASTTFQLTPDSIDLAFASDGSYVLAWEEGQTNGQFRTHIVSQRFNATGGALDALPVPITQFADQFNRPLTVARDSVGNTYIAWKNYTPASDRYDINVRRMLPNGALIGTQPTVVAQKIDSAASVSPEFHMNSNGKIVFAYSPLNTAAGHPTKIIVSQLDSSLTTVSQDLIDIANYSNISLAINASGHYAISYTDSDFEFSTLLQKVMWYAPDGKRQYSLSTPEPLNYASTLAMADDSSVVLGGPGFNDHLFRTRAYGEPTDLIAGPVTTDLANTLSLKYDLRFGTSGPLRVRFYKSADTNVDSTDQVLATMEFSDLNDLSVGTHTKTLPIGSLAGQIPVPGNGLPATTVDYFLLAKLDADDDLFENDIDLLSVDNTSSFAVHFNDAPVISGVITPIAYTENAAGLLIAPAGTVVDVDSVQPGYTDFNGGTMTFTLAANANVNDRLEIINQGTAAGQISFTGTKLFYGGVQIGTFIDGSGVTPLVISFTSAAATPAATQALLRAITFRTISELPSTLPRTLTISLTDGDGGTSSLISQTVNVISVPDGPVIGAFDTAIVYTENAASVALDTNATVIDIDSTDFDGGTLTAALVLNGEASDVLSIKPMGSGATKVLVSNGFVSIGGVSVGAVTGGTNSTPLVITFNSSATAARVQLLIGAFAYNSVSENPAPANRTVQLVMTDGDGGTSLPVAKSITVTRVNDAPAIGPLGSIVTYSAGDAPISFVSTSAITDIDSTNFDTGKLTVAISANAQTTDRLAIKSSGTATGQLSTTADFKVLLGGVQIGSYTGGIGTVPLVVTFNATVTPAVAQQVLASIQYSNVSALPSLAQRTIRVTQTDGDGGTSLAAIQKINVNDDPVLGTFGGPITYTRGGAAKLITTTATITDSSANFNTGVLTLALSGSDGSDVLAIQTSAALTIANTNEIFLNGLKLGTFVGGKNNTNLVITLTTNANSAKVLTLLKSIQFSSTTTATTPAQRTLQVTLTDGSGGVSSVVSKAINVL